MEGQKIPSVTMSFNIRALLRMFEDGGAALTKKRTVLAVCSDVAERTQRKCRSRRRRCFCAFGGKECAMRQASY